MGCDAQLAGVKNGRGKCPGIVWEKLSRKMSGGRYSPENCAGVAYPGGTYSGDLSGVKLFGERNCPNWGTSGSGESVRVNSPSGECPRERPQGGGVMTGSRLWLKVYRSTVMICASLVNTHAQKEKERQTDRQTDEKLLTGYTQLARWANKSTCVVTSHPCWDKHNYSTRSHYKLR